MKLWEHLPMNCRPKVRYWLPAAAMDEADLREEIRQLCARGFGGVELVVLGFLDPRISLSEDGWGTKNWDHMVDVAADETEKLGMSMDIAIGPGWPIASPVINNADDPAALHELTFGEITVEGSYDGPLPERRITHEEGTPKLVAVFAYQEMEEKVLKEDSYVDLRSCIEGDNISWTASMPGTWKLFAFYEQPAVHKINAEQTYVIDHHNKAGVKAVEQYWDTVFSKREPYKSMESFFCDSLEYQTSLDWPENFFEEFKARRGYDLAPYLPLLGLTGGYPEMDCPGYWFEDRRASDRINRDYVEVLTQLYCENHLAGLEAMAEKYGKTIRYQVSYNKMLEVERSGLYVAIPENEALGRPSIDYMKTMAAAAHLGRKQRHSFECAAEFGHTYDQDYEDLFWWIKRAAMAGMNAQVLHGASYSGGYHGSLAENGLIPGTTWPGFEGFGKFVSNYWNRTLSLEDARGCLDAVARINAVFRQKAKVDVLIYRDDYLSTGLGGEFCLYPDNGALANHGYSYEFASEALLYHPAVEAEEGVIDPEGPAYRALLIPLYEDMSARALERIAALHAEGLPVFFIKKKPDGKKYHGEPEEAFRAALDACSGIPVIPDYADVPATLEAQGILPRLRLTGNRDLMTAVREEDPERVYYALYAYNRIEFAPQDPNPDEMAVSALYKKGTTKGSYQRPGLSTRAEAKVCLEGVGQVSLLDPFSGQVRPLPFWEENGCMCGTLELEEDEMTLLLLEKAKQPIIQENLKEIYEIMPEFRTVAFASFEPNEPEETSFLRSGFKHYEDEKSITELLPWDAWDMDHFAGKAHYTATVSVPEVLVEGRYILELGEVKDTFRVWVNGMEAPFPDQVMKRVDITSLVQPGENRLEIVVTSNLYNKVFEDGQMPLGEGAFYRITKHYGIYETEGKKIRLRIFGNKA